ncbi:MAG: hypothetical protein IT359_02970 [Gemmatimonadaceae bacterium]|nr:hypothetical protein [Gemmatimonadaceae bacterium]
MLLSDGDASALERALTCIASPCRRLSAEILVVRVDCPDQKRTLDAAYPGVHFIDVDASSTLSERRELGISRASGDIVAVKIDGEVGDSSWLRPFERVVVTSDDAPMLDRDATPAPVRADDSAERKRSRTGRPAVPAAARRDRPMSTTAADALLAHVREM